jgi:YVTN family beta-propeller protein
MNLPRLPRRTLAVALALLATSAAAQTLQPRITVGTNPLSVAVNPITNKIYTANSGSNDVSVVSGASASVIATLPVSTYPAWVAVDAESNRVYASSLTGANTAVIDGASDTVLDTLLTGGAGWTAVNPINDAVYTLRYGAGDEVNMIQGQLYQGTASHRSFGPIALAVNPVNDWVYIVNSVTADIAVVDLTTYDPYPALKCPDGSGGFKPQPAPTDPWGACIDIPNPPVAVAINPVTNRIYGLSDAATDQISVIDGTNSTFTGHTPPGGLTGATTIAVNPVTNKIYAVFANGVAVMNGADNSISVVPIASGSAVAIGINVLTDKVYVAKDDGTLLVIDGPTNNATTVMGLTAGSTAIAVNPVTNMVYVTDAGGGVTPIVGATSASATSTGIATTITPLPGDTGGGSGTITLNAASAMTPAPLGTVRKVYFRIDNGAWLAATGTGPWSAPYSGLAPGSHTIEAFATNGLEAPSINTDLANVPIVGNLAAYTFTVSAAPVLQLGIAPSSLDFGGQSMGTTSPSQAVTVTNTGTGSVDVSGIVASSQFGQTNDCGTLAPSASCTVNVTFSPAVAAGALNSTVNVAGSLTITSNASGSPHDVGLAGIAEKSLVTHYYRSILRRAPDGGGKGFWEGEAARVAGLGANVNEAWYAMAQAFYFSAEYLAFNRSNSEFVTDLYTSFYNRAPDGGGLAFWTGELDAGLPREVLLAGFMFSPEFQAFTQAIFGNTTARAEVDAVGDFYRGFLARLPDDGGFGYWVGRFRTAQCQGAGEVYAEVEAISSAFAQLPEYASRGRTHAQYVGDLYNAFLRRGGDRQGVEFWVNALEGGTMSREEVRQQFIATPEFAARVDAIVNQGCTT